MLPDSAYDRLQKSSTEIVRISVSAYSARGHSVISQSEMKELADCLK